MKIGFLGLGKLGLPCALAVESRGHEVIGCDGSDAVCAAIAARKITYREEGAQEALSQSRLRLVSPGALAAESDIIFVAIQTPHEPRFEGVTPLPGARADFDYAYLKAGIAAIAAEIAARGEDKIVVVISTVLPGTIAREIKPLLNANIKLCYNPFFIAMGTTMRDFLHPEFVLLGVEDEAAARTVEAFYQTLHGAPVFKTTVASAELAKVAYNTFIGMKIVFANTMMEICHKTGANVDAISDAMALANQRLISPAYLRGGMGDGGGCHPRDNIALSWLARKLDLRFDFFEALMIARERQTEWLADLMIAEADRRGLPLVILGKSFKPETAITTGSPALLLQNILAARGRQVQAFDPFVDGDAPAFAPSVFLIATKHPQFAEMSFPAGSVAIDPWRYIATVGDEVELIRVGE